MSPRRAELATWLDPARTALIVIDAQADFASPDGAMARAGADLSAIPSALAAMARLVEAAHAAGVSVIFTRVETRPQSDSAAWADQIRRRGGDPDLDAAVCRAGSAGADFFGLHPAETDRVIAKRRYSAFFATGLHEALRARGIDTLALCGLTTECCVDCTARDAFHLDYRVFIAADACAAYEADLHAAALKSLELNCAILVSSAEIVEAWRK